MNNQEKLLEAFSEALGVNSNIITNEMKYNDISQWDSVANMSLIAEIEEVFDIMIDSEDVIKMNSVREIKEILTKYDINF